MTPSDFTINFTNYDIKDVVTWAKERNIIIEQEYKYDDVISEYHVISQDIEEGISVKRIKKIKVVVSNGLDPSKVAEVTNMVGWKLDDVIEFIDENKLTNVTINFEHSDNVEKDVIISQDAIKEIKRNDPLTLVSSLGKESDKYSVTLDNLIGLDIFHATIYLKRNELKYSFIYTLDEERAGKVIKQNLKKWSVIGPEHKEEIILTIAKDDEVTVPDFSKMSKTDITDWAATNHIKIEFSEDYDDTIKKDNVISYDIDKGTTIEVGTLINVVLSKGPLKMIEFIDFDSFKEWADENNAEYEIEYKFSDTIKKGKLISSNYKANETIKNDDIINLVISDGSMTIVPKLINLSRENAEKKCEESNIKCIFEYVNDNSEYTIVSEQSMKPNSQVPSETLVTLKLGK